MNAKTPFALKSLAIAVMAVSLAACSDSDSDSSPGAGSGSDPVTQASLSGTAAKGILIGAEVLACTTPRLNECASSNSSNRLGRAITDENGNYTIENLPSDGQGVFIHVRRPTTGTPQMVCDLPQGCGEGKAFGSRIDMPNLSLRSVAVLDGPDVEASVTPLTELVAAAAERSGDGQISRAAIAEGNRAVREALGLGDMTELQTIRPVDITQASASEASPEAQRLSLLSAAFAETDANGNIVTSRLQTLRQALSDSSEINTETLTAINTQVTEIANKNTSLNNAASGLNTTINARVDACQNGCTVTVDNTVTQDQLGTRGTNATAVRDLVSNVRTLGWEIVPAFEKALSEESRYGNNDLIGNVQYVTDTHLRSSTFEPIAEPLGYVIEAVVLAGEAWLKNGRTPNLSIADILKQQHDGANNQEEIDLLFGDAQLTWTSGTRPTVSYSNQNLAGADISIEVQLPNRNSNELVLDIKQLTVTTNTGNQDDNNTPVALSLTTGQITASSNTSFVTHLNNGGDDSNFYFDSIRLEAAGELTVENITFEGEIKLALGSTEAMRTANRVADGVDQIYTLLPESVHLKGGFRQTSNETYFLEAELGARLVNYNDFTYYVEGRQMNDVVPVTVDPRENGNILGLVYNGQEFATLSYVVHGHDATLRYEMTKDAQNVGGWHSANIDTFNTETYPSLVEFFKDENNDWVQRHLSDIFYLDLEEGQIRVELNVNENDQFTANTFVRGFASTEPADNFAQVSAWAKVNGRLSNNLPEMDIRLDINRTELEGGNATLTLGWAHWNNNAQRNFITLEGVVSEAELQSLVVKDRSGTTMNLNLIDREDRVDNIVGTISISGTTYANITDENGVFIVTYLYGVDGHPSSERDAGFDFETLF